MTAQYDAGYNTGVEEIFFNIWRKRWDIDYSFSRVELMNRIVSWIMEKEGMLDTRPPPFF